MNERGNVAVALLVVLGAIVIWYGLVYFMAGPCMYLEQQQGYTYVPRHRGPDGIDTVTEKCEKWGN